MRRKEENLPGNFKSYRRGNTLRPSAKPFNIVKLSIVVASVENLQAVYERSLDLFSRGRLAEAAESFTGLIATLPKWAQLYSDRGAVFNRMGQAREALADLARAIELDPRLAAAYVNIASSLGKQGKGLRAIWFFDRAAYLGLEAAAGYAAAARRQEYAAAL